jgi:arylsulfatase A-like enzyme
MSPDRAPGRAPGLGGKILAGLLGLLLLGEALVFAADGPAPLYRDALEYWKLATRAASGDWWLLADPEAARTPGYPWFLALCQRLFAERALVAVAVQQHLFVAASGAIAAWIGWRVTGSLVAVNLALALSLLCLSRHVIAPYVWSDNLLAFALALHAACLVAWWRRPAAVRAALLGLSLGACTLVKPSAELAFVPTLLTLGFGLRRAGGPRRLRRFAAQAALLVGGFGLVVGPWLLRNQVAFGQPFLTRFQGRTLWLSAFYPAAAGLPLPAGPEGRRVLAALGPARGSPRELWPVYLALRRSGLSELEADGRMAAAAREAVAAQPLAFARSVASRFLRFWTVPYDIPRWREDPLVLREGTTLDQRTGRLAGPARVSGRLLAGFWRPRAEAFGAAALATFLGLASMARRAPQRGLALGLGGLLVYFASVTALASLPLYRFRAILEPIFVAVLAIAATPLCLRAGRALRRGGRLRALAALPAWLAVGCAEPAPPNLVLVSIDTLRAAQLGGYGYPRPTTPFLDRLAAEGVLFEEVIANSPWTLPSHASLLTGLYPRSHGVRDHGSGLPEEIPTLATLLRGAGYATFAVVNSHVLGGRHGLARGFERFRYFPERPGNRRVRSAAAEVEQATAWLEQRDARPFFLFFHSYDVHSDYNPDPEFLRLFRRPGSGSFLPTTAALQRVRLGELRLGPPDRDSLVDHYDAGLRQLDRDLERLFAWLERRGLAGRTVFVVTSDHGEELLEHGGVLHGHTLYEEVLRVPLILRGPGLPRGVRVAGLAQLSDVLPTLLALAGVPAPPRVEGRDLAPGWRSGRLPAGWAFAEADERDRVSAVRDGSRKLIHDRRADRFELYDLAVDPGERRDLAPSDPASLNRLRAELERYRSAGGRGVELPPLAPEQAESLKALGYVE